MSLPSVLAPGDDYLSDGHSFHLGLAYIAAVLRDNGLDVKILDCYAEDRLNVRPSLDSAWQEMGLTDEQIVEQIQAYAPDLIGITIPFSCQHYLAISIARLIKQRFPGIVLVAGGNHVTAVPEEIDRTVIDYLVIGEGEYAFLTLVNLLSSGQPVEAVPGLVSKGCSEYVRSDFIDDLDKLPFPAIDLLPLSKIWRSGRRWINMVATRGCVFDCNFCSIHTVMGRRIRRRGIENILAEIEHWERQYRIQEIYFEDDNLTANKRWAKELFRRIAERNFGIRFFARNGIRADTVDKELLTLMKAAGFQDFMIAPESGSQRTLDLIIGKKMRLEDCTRAVGLARETNLGVNLFFVIGFPQETWEDIEATINYAHSLKKLGAKGVWISLASPYPGTRLFEECLEKGLLPKDFDYRKCRTADYQIINRTYSAGELKAFRAKAMAELTPRNTIFSMARNACKYLLTDPSYFVVKLRYKLRI